MKRFYQVKFYNITLILSLSACSIAGPAADELNPYGEGNSVEVLGQRDLSALQGAGSGGSKAAESARHALEVMGSYRRAQAPEPAYPVVRPAEVRLMWVPDHLNKHGDLVTSHYYYLRVLNDRWAVQDAFELEQQLKNNPGINYSNPQGTAAPAAANSAAAPASGASYGTGEGDSGASTTPWVYKEE